MPLVDPYDRTVRDLRISITDRCNFRCTYCMPQEVRAHLPVLIARLAALGVDLALTTNGATLGRFAGDLQRAGLRRINISLDTLRPDRFSDITRRDALDDVLAGIDAARQAGLAPIKINCVLVRGINDDEILDFAEFGRERGLEVRFIEWMPLDGGGSWTADQVVPAREVIDRIDAVWPVDQIAARGAAPADTWTYRDGGGRIGVIASVTQAFCGTCDRIRLTAEGQLRNCPFSVRETDLRAILRSGGSDDELAAAVEAEVGRKWAGHAIGQVRFIRPARSMSQIGG